MLSWPLLLALSSPLFAEVQEHVSPEQIEIELQSAENDFEKAKKMFNPWYTGPIIAASSSAMPPGWGNIQPYVYVIDNYARFDEKRHSHGLDSDLVVLNPLVYLQFGVTSSMDTTIMLQGSSAWQSEKGGGGFGDFSWNVGFPICKQTLNLPGIRFVVKEIFPTGKYQHLDPLALQMSGGGSYQTQLMLAVSKIVFWEYLHPMNLRFNCSYNIPSSVHVKGYNAYGGGHGTNALVSPGNTLALDVGVEVSLSQRWVFATDIAYTAQNETTFTGYAGLTDTGEEASLGGGFNDSLSLAPAIEYNWNENLGVLGGVWFSVYGRNSLNFLSGVVSLTWTFSVN